MSVKKKHIEMLSDKMQQNLKYGFVVLMLDITMWNRFSCCGQGEWQNGFRSFYFLFGLLLSREKALITRR